MTIFSLNAALARSVTDDLPALLDQYRATWALLAARGAAATDGSPVERKRVDDDDNASSTSAG